VSDWMERLSQIPPDAVSELMRAGEGLFKTQTRRGEEYARKLLDKAQQDLKSSEVLYNSKDYTNSVSLIQQSVEKTAKSYGLTMGYLSKERLRDVGHFTPAAFMTIFESKQAPRFVLAFGRIMYGGSYPYDERSVEKELIKFRELTGQLNRADSRQKIAGYSKEELEWILDRYVTKQLPTEHLVQSIIPAILAKAPRRFRRKMSKSKPAKEILAETIRELISLSLCHWDLYVLALITFPHAVSTRYPDDRPDLSDYTIQKGIVVVEPRLWEINGRAITAIAQELRPGVPKSIGTEAPRCDSLHMPSSRDGRPHNQ